MKETIYKQIDQIKEFWQSRTKTQKLILIFSFVATFLIIFSLVYFSSKTTYVPLYTNLTPTETASIKESLDAKGIKSEITDGGTTILISNKENIDELLVQFASEGIPKSGNIDYSFFGQNSSFGMTENEFNVLKLSAMQTELARLLETVEGVQRANVMLTLPNKGIFVSDVNEEASAAIILETKPGYQFNENQIRSLYHLVSKSIPNLPVENIEIRNQNLEYFDLKQNSPSENLVAQQIQIKREIEKDIQRQVHRMLGTLMGFDKVVTIVTADIDFTQENREENIVLPVDEENMSGIVISAQRITETYSGNTNLEEGIPVDENDTEDSLQYLEGSNLNGDYERTEETINREINRIRKEIIESPYKIRDLGIQVIVEPPESEQIDSFSDEIKEDIENILMAIVKTTIHKEEGTELSEEDLANNVTVSVQKFNGKPEMITEEKLAIPIWIYAIGILLVLVILILLIVILNRKSTPQKVEEIDYIEDQQPMMEDIPNLQEEPMSESAIRRKQIEELAKEKPDEFAKLLRTWLAED